MTKPSFLLLLWWAVGVLHDGHLTVAAMTMINNNARDIMGRSRARSSIALCSTSSSPSSVASAFTIPKVIVFGRPGAGKTTVANGAVRLLNHERNHSLSCCLGLDLDVCVPQWMKDNFGKGIYPTSEERIHFAQDACDYVDQQIIMMQSSTPFSSSGGTIAAMGTGTTTTTTFTTSSVVISFSFVNTDLRDVFRRRFPEAEWILIDTDEQDAQWRIDNRQDHFYKGTNDGTNNGTNNISMNDTIEESKSRNNNVEDTGTALASPTSKEDAAAQKVDSDDNSDWQFARVTFPHTILNGLDSIDDNAHHIATLVQKRMGTTMTMTADKTNNL